MKKILLTLFIAFSALATQAQEIKWLTLDEALAAQKKTPKPIFMDVYTDWCGPCKMLDKNTFHDAAIVKFISDNFYAVKFNAEGNFDVTYKGQKYSNPNYQADRKGRNAQHQFAGFLQITGYPSMVIFDKKGEIQPAIVGYHTPEQLMPQLKNIVNKK